MPDPEEPPLLELDRVTRSYSTGAVVVDALRDASLVIREGEFVAITGESGSGKSTLLGILGCLDRTTSGSYRLVGQEVAALPEAVRAKVRAARIGFVFQAYNLLPRATAYANVELPLIYARAPSRDRRERVLAALASVGLGDRVDHRPNQLSGGQQQRVAIARALVNRPSILLADEPTGNLDSAGAQEVLRLLEAVNASGTTIALVTHSDRVSERASRVLHVSDGEVAG
ncbi:MAG: ABC transporter ATP-binding protein [Acidimicrobiales bacterium]